MEPRNTSTRPLTSESLPAEVLDALSWSAVHGIHVLQKSQGVGLYDAKLAIDAFLEQHPEHPLAQQINQRSQMAEHWERTENRAALIGAESVVGTPLELESLPNKALKPEAYVLFRAAILDGGEWFSTALRACIETLSEQSLEIVDEERCSEYGDLASAALKITQPMTAQEMKSLAEKIMQKIPLGVTVHIVQAVNREDASLPTEDLQVEYFVTELATASRMILHTTSCVKLRHQPTGLLARSTIHRNKNRNYEEALLLLAAIVKDKNKV